MKTKIHDLISVELPFALISVTKLKIKQGLYDHSKAWLEGIVQDQDVQACSNISWRENVTIRFEDGPVSQILFSGVPCGIKIKYEGQAYVSMEFCSRTIFMDYEKKTRSFQRKNKSYKALFRELVKANGGDIIDYVPVSDVYEAPLIQYEETDWEFLKRISSHIGVPVYPNPTGGTAWISIGLGSNHNFLDSSTSRTVKRRINEILYFFVDGGWNYSLGDQVTYEGRSLLVTGIEDSYDGGLLSRRCLLEDRESVIRKRSYQKLLKGSSLKRVITAVETDRKVPEEKSHWYSWHKNDWYGMPEEISKATL